MAKDKAKLDPSGKPVETPDEKAIEKVEDAIDDAAEELEAAHEEGKVTPQWASRLATKIDELHKEVADLKAKQGTMPEVSQMETRLASMETTLQEVRTAMLTQSEELTPELESQKSDDQPKKKQPPKPKNKAPQEADQKPKKNWL